MFPAVNVQTAGKALFTSTPANRLLGLAGSRPPGIIGLSGQPTPATPSTLLASVSRPIEAERLDYSVVMSAESP